MTHPATPDWLRRMGVELPILQAPMAGSQGSVLAIAVSEAGGLGALPAAMLSPQALRDELAAITTATHRPYNVNFFAHTPPQPDPQREAAWREALVPYFAEFRLDPAAIPPGAGRRPFDAEAAEVLEAFRPPVVSFHFGLPEPALLARVKGWGARVLSSATTVAEARWLEAHGADVVIAQGLEAGGHRGMFLTDDLHSQLGSLALLAQVRVGKDPGGGRRRHRRRPRGGCGAGPGRQRGAGGHCLLLLSGSHYQCGASPCAADLAGSSDGTHPPVLRPAGTGAGQPADARARPAFSAGPGLPAGRYGAGAAARPGGGRRQLRLLAAVVGSEPQRLQRATRR